MFYFLLRLFQEKFHLFPWPLVLRQSFVAVVSDKVNYHLLIQRDGMCGVKEEDL